MLPRSRDERRLTSPGSSRPGRMTSSKMTPLWVQRWNWRRYMASVRIRPIQVEFLRRSGNSSSGEPLLRWNRDMGSGGTKHWTHRTSSQRTRHSVRIVPQVFRYFGENVFSHPVKTVFFLKLFHLVDRSSGETLSLNFQTTSSVNDQWSMIPRDFNLYKLHHLVFTVLIETIFMAEISFCVIRFHDLTRIISSWLFSFWWQNVSLCWSVKSYYCFQKSSSLSVQTFCQL